MRNLRSAMCALESFEQQKFEDMLRSLVSISGDFRIGVLSRQIDGMQAEEAARYIAWICQGSRRRQPREATIVYNCLVELCIASPKLHSAKRREILKAAAEQGLDEVNVVLTVQTANTSGSPVSETAVQPVLAQTTLGERKALARRSSSFWLERLVQDPNPSVIRNLLANPRVTEREVLKIAARTPAPSGVLMEIAHSQRWIRRYRIKKALILNPSAPMRVTMALLNTVLTQDLQLVVESSDLPCELRERARQLLDEKHARIPLPSDEEPIEG